MEVDGIKFSTGGVVFNTGLALYKLGIKTNLITKIADDYLGNIIKEKLKNKDEELLKNLIEVKGEFSSYTIVLNPDDTDRIFLHYPGLNETYKAEDISCKQVQEDHIFHFGYPPLLRQFYKNEGKESVKLFKKIKKLGIVTSLDMTLPDSNSESGNVDWNIYLDNVLPYVNIFAPSFEELLYMIAYPKYKLFEAGKIEITPQLLDYLADSLIKKGADIILIKLGNQGLYMRSKNINNSLLTKLISAKKWSQKQMLAPCFSVDVVDTTGAGDTTIAGFLASVFKGNNPETALEIATAVGAHCVEELGAISGIKPLSNVESRIENGWEKRTLNIKLDAWEFNQKHKLYVRR
ncbi:MAG: carbohydrate kinase family protein [bacterium]